MPSISEIEAGIFGKIMYDENVLKPEPVEAPKIVHPFTQILEAQEEMTFEEVWDVIEDIDLAVSVDNLFKHDVFQTCPNDLFRVQEHLKNIHNWRCKPPFEDFKKDVYKKWTSFMNVWTQESKTRFLLSYMCVYIIHCQHKITLQEYKDMIKAFN